MRIAALVSRLAAVLLSIALISLPACDKKEEGPKPAAAKKADGDKAAKAASSGKLASLPAVCQKVEACCIALAAEVPATKATCDATINGYAGLIGNEDAKPDFEKLCAQSLQAFQANPNAPSECK